MKKFLVALSILGAELAQGEPLGFDAALTLAERSAPDVEMRTAAFESARAEAVAAGRLPDPKLLVGVENLPATGADQWSFTRDFMTMRKVGVSQELSNRARRRAASEIADAAIAKSEAERRVRVLEIRRDTALAWLNRYYIEQRGALLDELVGENRLFADAVQSQLIANRGTAADTVIPKQEAADLDDRRDALLGDIVKAKADLKRWVGAAADEPLAGTPPQFTIDAEHLRAHVHEHPELAVFAPMSEMAQAEVHEAEAMKRPDWGVELAYAKRGSAFSDMVSLQLTVGLPIFSGTRHDPHIEAKRQEVRRVDFERNAMLKDHTRELENVLADYETLTRQLKRLDETRIPLSAEKVEYQFGSYRGGKGDLTAVLMARRELIDLKVKRLELESQRMAVIAKLYYIYGEGAQ